MSKMVLHFAIDRSPRPPTHNVIKCLCRCRLSAKSIFGFYHSLSITLARPHSFMIAMHSPLLIMLRYSVLPRNFSQPPDAAAAAWRTRFILTKPRFEIPTD